MKPMTKQVILFDGHCNLCNWFINFIIKKDKNRLYFFSPLTGRFAKEKNIYIPKEIDQQSVILYLSDKRQLYQSDAVLEICTNIFRFGVIFKILRIFPRFIRDRLYVLVAKNRYKFFGVKKNCRLPSQEEKSMFIE